MIDLHCHILPGVDDGAPDDEQSIAMARIAVAEGITIQACTPHMFPGVYNNAGPDIRARIQRLQTVLDEAGVPLTLVTGSDLHIAPDLLHRLRNGDALSLHDTRYTLLETPHHVLPPRVEESFFALLTAGYVPILTHPERMSWIDRNYDVVQRLHKAGTWMQVTAGAITGRFGARARYWSERMLDEGMVHIVATDAHDTVRRPPLVREAYDLLCARMGEVEANNLILHRPHGILENRPVSEQPPTPSPSGAVGDDAGGGESGPSLMDRITSIWRRN